MFNSKYKLIEHFRDLGFKNGAEIGVAEGHLSEYMLKTIPGLHLTCVDSWTPYKENRWSGSKERNDHHFKKTEDRLYKYNVSIIRAFSMDAVKQIRDESLDFVYIDACHAFDYVMQDLIEWSKKVKKGGIVSGDDYFDFRGAGVIEAVNSYTKAHNIKFNLTDPLTYKIRDREAYEQPSFWWIKP